MENQNEKLICVEKYIHLIYNLVFYHHVFKYCLSKTETLNFLRLFIPYLKLYGVDPIRQHAVSCSTRHTVTKWNRFTNRVDLLLFLATYFLTLLILLLAARASCCVLQDPGLHTTSCFLYSLILKNKMAEFINFPLPPTEFHYEIRMAKFNLI